MASATRKLTHHSTVTGGATDIVTLTGPDVAAASNPISDAPYASTPGGTGAGQVKGGRVFNAGSDDLWWSYGPTADVVPDPLTTTNEGVRRLPAGMTDEWDEVWPQAVVKVSAAVDTAYDVEGNP